MNTATRNGTTNSNGRRNRKRYDSEIVRQTAAHRWPEIFNRLLGWPMELMDGRHHGCPMCGQGKDCYRFIDEEKGAVLCNRCFSQQNGDAFAALMKATGKRFPEVVALVAEYLGVQPSTNGSHRTKKKTSEDAVKAVWRADDRLADLSASHIDRWCKTKPPITPAAVNAFCGQYGRAVHSGGGWGASLRHPIAGRESAPESRRTQRACSLNLR